MRASPPAAKGGGGGAGEHGDLEKRDLMLLRQRDVGFGREGERRRKLI